MWNGSACDAISLPCPDVVDRQFTPCVPFSMPSSISCATSCPWRYLPCNFPPWQTVFYHFRRLRDPRHLVSPAHDLARSRTRASGQECAAERSDRGCGIRVKTVEESAGIWGFDAHTCVKGGKRHILVDTLGLLLSVYVTPADLHDSRGTRCLIAGLAPLLPRLKKI